MWESKTFLSGTTTQVLIPAFYESTKGKYKQDKDLWHFYLLYPPMYEQM